MTIKITPEVMEVLTQCTTEENKLFLPSVQLERSLYEAVNKVLKALGGNWNKSAKAHLFPHDPSDMLDEIINTGEYTDEKKEYQFFQTPGELAEEMVVYAKSYFNGNSVVLDGDEVDTLDGDPYTPWRHAIWCEPNVGLGRIYGQFPPSAPTIVCDLNPEIIEKFRKEFDYGQSSLTVITGDFLEQDIKADIIVMNPPFSKQQDVKHVLHAWKCLNEGGVIVSIMTPSAFYRQTKLSEEFRNTMTPLVNKSLPEGTFKESGTMVNTHLVVFRK